MLSLRKIKRNSYRRARKWQQKTVSKLSRRLLLKVRHPHTQPPQTKSSPRNRRKKIEEISQKRLKIINALKLHPKLILH